MMQTFCEMKVIDGNQNTYYHVRWAFVICAISHVAVPRHAISITTYFSDSEERNSLSTGGAL